MKGQYSKRVDDDEDKSSSPCIREEIIWINIVRFTLVTCSCSEFFKFELESKVILLHTIQINLEHSTVRGLRSVTIVLRTLNVNSQTISTGDKHTYRIFSRFCKHTIQLETSYNSCVRLKILFSQLLSIFYFLSILLPTRKESPIKEIYADFCQSL